MSSIVSLYGCWPDKSRNRFGYYTVVEWYSVGFRNVIINLSRKCRTIDTCKQLDLKQRGSKYLSTIKIMSFDSFSY